MNLLWRNVNGFIIWGDTLRRQARCGWVTRHTGAGGEVGILDQERAQFILENAVKAMVQTPQQVLATPEQKAEIQEAAEEIRTARTSLDNSTSTSTSKPSRRTLFSSQCFEASA